MLISENVNALRQTIDLTKVTVVAVTKTQPQKMIRQAAATGLTVFGENRVQEAAEKIQSLTDLACQWHLIGHLQTNKAKQAVALFSMIQSVDSLNLAKEINRHANNIGKIQDVLLQVNVAQEQSKFGIDPQSVEVSAAEIDGLTNLRLCGLMTIAPFFEDPENARSVFQATKSIFDQLKSKFAARDYFKWLSMGMTHDYIVAVQEGSNMIRIGTGIFGARDGR